MFILSGIYLLSMQLEEKQQLNQWKNTNAIINWFTAITNKITNPFSNSIQYNLRTSMNERTYIFIKIYLSHFILERIDVSVARGLLGQKRGAIDNNYGRQ